jgi:C-22 sterol desaturase
MASFVDSVNASAAAFPAQFQATIASVNTAGVLSKISENATPTNLFGVFMTLFLAAVVYDQRKQTTVMKLRSVNLD